MKHEEVIEALKTIAEKESAAGISKDKLQELKSYNLITFTEDAKAKEPACVLTKKGRVMLKANSK